MAKLIICLLIGSIIGLIGGFINAVKIGAGGSTTENHIGKVKTKGDSSPINAAQIQQPQKEKQKRGIFRKIFKRKKNE